MVAAEVEAEVKTDVESTNYCQLSTAPSPDGLARERGHVTIHAAIKLVNT
jgi:hypothetical protein